MQNEQTVTTGTSEADTQEVVNDTHVELDGEGPEETTDNEGNTVKVPKTQTVEEKLAQIAEDAKKKANAIKEKERLKEQAKKDKEKEKAENAAKRRADKLTTALEKTDKKEADVAGEASGGRVKKFVGLTEEEAKAVLETLKGAAADKKKADALALRTNLTDDERKELTTFERTIEKFLPSFQTAAFQIGMALAGINSKRLYRQEYATFEEYVQARFDLSRPHAYSVMAAARTFDALTEGEKFDAKDMPSITAAEAIDRGVKGLLKASNVDTDDANLAAITRQLARNVYALATQTAPVDSEGKAILSPAHLTSVFTVMSDVARTGTVELDGKAIPVNLAAASIDEMITNESAERTARAKQYLADQFAATQTAIRDAKHVGIPSGAVVGSGTGAKIPEGVKPRLTVICSVHGKVEIDATTDMDITLGCKCVFIATPEGYMWEKNTAEGVTA